MRVLHVIAGAPTGGAETFAQDAISALAEKGVEQRVICRPHPIALARYAEAAVPVETLSFSPFSRLFGGPALVARQAKDLGADLVHAWMSRAASFVPAGLGCPVIGWFGGYYHLKYFKTSDVFVGVTPDLRRHIIDEGAPAERSFVCHTFGTLPDDPAPVDRASLDTPADAQVLLILSRMHWMKGIDTAIEAMTHLPPRTYLWLAGEGPEKSRYQALAGKLGLNDRVRFLGWRTDRKALLEACDICLLPSRVEPFGTVIAEAWSMHRPLIAAPAAGAKQFVEDNDDGLLFPIDDAKALADCVQRIGTDPALARHLMEAGYRKYDRLFSKPTVIRDLLALYEKTLELGRLKR